MNTGTPCLFCELAAPSAVLYRSFVTDAGGFKTITADVWDSSFPDDETEQKPKKEGAFGFGEHVYDL